MPRLMQILVGADFREDGTATMGTLQETIIEQGCVSLQFESMRRGVSAESIKQVFSSMSGVTCDAEKCCITDFSLFSANMKKLSGGV